MKVMRLRVAHSFFAGLFKKHEIHAEVLKGLPEDAEIFDVAPGRGQTIFWVTSAEFPDLHGGEAVDAPFIDYHVVDHIGWEKSRRAAAEEALLKLASEDQDVEDLAERLTKLALLCLRRDE